MRLKPHSVPLSVTFAPYSFMGAGVSLKWAIFGVTWALLAGDELRRTPLWRGSHSGHSRKFAFKEFSEVAPSLATSHTWMHCVTRRG
jgi:hypothetical protein